MDKLRTAVFLLLIVAVSCTTGDHRNKREDGPPADPDGGTSAEPAAEPHAHSQPLEPTADPTGTETMTNGDEGPPKTNCTTDKEWMEKAIERHNYYRAKHGAPLLVHSETLCEIAQAYANHLAQTHKVEHNPALKNSKYGENLYYNANTFPMPVDPKVPVDAWYSEIHDYDFKTGFAIDNSDKEILHFTQLVWKATTEVGIALGKGRRPDNMHANYVVANYNPKGNFDDFLINVLPASDSDAKPVAVDNKVDEVAAADHGDKAVEVTAADHGDKGDEVAAADDGDKVDEVAAADVGDKGDAETSPGPASGCVRNWVGISAILIVLVAGLVSYMFLDI